MSRTWLTVDTDDAHHRPWRQGHPTRSKDPEGQGTSREPSDAWIEAVERFGSWVERSGQAVTVFVIQDQLEQPDARKVLIDLAARGGPLLTFASHGTSHRAWGAWPEDAAGLTAAVKRSFAANEEAFGEQARPWCRAPSGYVAPWMADALSQAGVTVDSSVNPSRLVRRKAGPTRRWSDVMDAMRQANVVERPWHVHRGWPVCGPALHLPGLAGRARRAWRNLPHVLDAVDVRSAVEGRDDLTTVYWHVADHMRRKGRWEPPLKST